MKYSISNIYELVIIYSKFYIIKLGKWKDNI